MMYVLLIFQTALVSGIALFTLSFLITSLKEHEPRAAMMAGALCVFLIGMELGIYVLYTLGFFFILRAACWGSPAPSIGPVSYPMLRPWRRPFRFRPISENRKVTARRFTSPEISVHL